ncbi:MFS transporter [Novosphingobium sp. YAF33]|jgi:acyl-[acyl-carrier-protein]-phospholipid O-acyltransferase/long-chain-fatty-acid--[acyl-carrier-protein] ligase|uniref:MFS transporter n=1 Tax=Novosphingobium sp. YAF33 TaxID=3233082 RepID=UPI003F9A9BB2
MSAPDLSLLAKRRFAPMFVVQFLGAFNDNLLKFAMLFLANFVIFAGEADKAGMLAAIASGVFIAPYFLFSALAGQLADRIDKARLVRWIKLAEIAIMAVGLGGFWLQSIPVLMTALFLMGLHSTLFGPVKYSILPQHLAAHEIMGGTGLIEAGTFLAILGGQLLAGVIPAREAGLAAMGIAFLGYLAARAIPPAPPVRGEHPVDWNLWRGTMEVLRTARTGRAVWLSVLGISWFFAAGAVLVSEFAPLVSGTLAARQEVATVFLVIFSVTIALGSLAVNKLLGGEVSARYVPISALGLAIGLIDLWLSTSGFIPAAQEASFRQFLANPGAPRILADLVLVAFSGGIFIVPLYAILQMYSAAEERSRIIAANNIVNAAVTVGVVLAMTGLLAAGLDVPELIGVLGFASLAAALFGLRLARETATG